MKIVLLQNTAPRCSVPGAFAEPLFILSALLLLSQPLTRSKDGEIQKPRALRAEQQGNESCDPIPSEEVSGEEKNPTVKETALNENQTAFFGNKTSSS